MAKPRTHPKPKRQRTQRILHAVDLVAAPRPTRGEKRAGSIVQQLDMAEKGPLRGDEILHHHGIPAQPKTRHPDLDDLLIEENFSLDLSEEGREGDEETGDEHSSGLQGSDQQELQYDTEHPEDADSGYPGEMTEKNAHLDPTRKGYRRRAS